MLLIPAECQKITVCIEDDDDLRVDCEIEPKLNQINDYVFSWSVEKKQVVINTNVSGSSAEPKFKDKSQVEELVPHGYRMTLKDFKDKLPANTTYMCKVSDDSLSITMEKGRWIDCGWIRSEWDYVNCLHPTSLFFLCR